jgi:hypothetical protein
MTKQLTITMNDWVVDQVVGNIKNKSQRIEELLIKAYINEREERIRENISKSALDGFLSHVACEV